MSLHDLIGRTAACVKCGAVGIGSCRCWVECACGWTKERGADGCSRCSSVQWLRARPGQFEATIGDFRLLVWKASKHWTFAVTTPDGAEWGARYLTYTAKASRQYAVARAWKSGAPSPSPTVVGGARKLLGEGR